MQIKLIVVVVVVVVVHLLLCVVIFVFIIVFFAFIFSFFPSLLQAFILFFCCRGIPVFLLFSLSLLACRFTSLPFFLLFSSSFSCYNTFSQFVLSSLLLTQSTEVATNLVPRVLSFSAVPTRRREPWERGCMGSKI